MKDKLVKPLMTEVECNKMGNGGCSTCEYEYADDKCAQYYTEIIADNLLANGVTVQEWISVKDRLPEHGETCLVYTKFEEAHTRQWDNVEMWWVGDNASNDFRMNMVTHWMPLPQPPKGE